MTPDVVVDIGNTRIKWGLCSSTGVGEVVSLPEDPAAWRAELEKRGRGPFPGNGPRPLFWVLASVRPQRCRRLYDWLVEQGHTAVVLEKAAQLPLVVDLPAPDKVGIDRLLDAVAAARRLPAGTPAVLVDAGSAVTVDWLDESHTFRGGAIFPGLGLMARALHDHTALLPLVEVADPDPPLPGPDTPTAMQTGILMAVAGGVERIVAGYQSRSGGRAAVFLTGGDGPLLSRVLAIPGLVHWPEQTLAGIFHSARELTP